MFPFRYIPLSVIFAGLFFFSCRKKLDTITDKAVFVANEEDGSVSVIDAVSLKEVKRIRLKSSWIAGRKRVLMSHNIQVSPDNSEVWVTGVPEDHSDKEQVLVIDPVKMKIKERVKFKEHQHLAHVVLDDDCRYAFVTSNAKGEVLQISTKSYEVYRRYYLGSGSGPHGMRYHNGRLFIANMNAQSLSVINILYNSVQEIKLYGTAVQVAVVPDGRYVYVSLFDKREVARVDLSNMQVKYISLPAGSQGPIQLYCTPDSKLLYVCDQGGLMERESSDKVYVIDVNTSAVVKTITCGNKAHGIVIDDAGEKAYVTNSGEGTISVIDLQTQEVSATVPVGKGPNGISWWKSP